MRIYWRYRQLLERLFARLRGGLWLGRVDFLQLKRFLRCVFCALNPFSWGERTVKVVVTLFFMVALPVYLFLGMQPNIPADAASFPRLTIAGIDLDTPVEALELEGRQLKVPDMIAGSYSSAANKTLIVGHSSTVFEELDEVELGQEIEYDGRNYEVIFLETLEKSNISMTKVLAEAEQDTIVLMTCAGEPLPDQDATHRLIITARIKQ